MFERYTEPGRRAIFFARLEASKFGSPTIESEHLLLGLMHDSRRFLQRISNASLDGIRMEIEELAPPKSDSVPTSTDLPLSLPLKRALAFSAEEAERLNHPQIGPEHHLLGLLRKEGGAEVSETHHFFHGHEITLVERLGLSEDGKTISYTQEITGPGKSTSHTVHFDVPRLS